MYASDSFVSALNILLLKQPKKPKLYNHCIHGIKPESGNQNLNSPLRIDLMVSPTPVLTEADTLN